ncbi:hypothetical protein IAU59_001699 [Kwoniella sp. CBS 9459]
MARGIACGSFLLFAAFALLLVSTVSAPVFRQISFLEVRNSSQKLAFGVFGYCTNVDGGGNHGCTDRRLGYDIADVTGSLANFTYVNDRLEGLTKALILHPIATGLAFLSFLIALCSDRLGFLFASLIAFFAFLVSLAAMVVDFVMFGIIRNQVNNNSSTINATAKFDNAIWLTLAATVILFFSTFIVCFETCTARRRTRDKEVGYAGNGAYVGNQGGMMGQTQSGYAPGYQKRHFWNRNKY